MREILFRQWINGKAYFWGVGLDDNTFVGAHSNGHSNALNTVHEQYTGIKDMDGNKIFEGDIVESSIFICPLAVYYNKDLAMYRLTAGGNSDDGDFIQYEGSVFKVIGNIHQNPELIK